MNAKAIWQRPYCFFRRSICENGYFYKYVSQLVSCEELRGLVQDSDLVVIGHFSIDTIHLPSRTGPLVILGGSVAYSSLVTRRLGGSVAVISKVGGDFPEAYW